MTSRSALTREAILSIAQALPPGPRAFAELEQRLRKTETDLGEIAALIKRDGALAASVIRTSNSVVFGGEQRVGAVEEAVARVGLAEIYRLAGFLAGAQLIDRPLNNYGITIDQLRDNMLQTAFLAERLAEELGLDGRLAYTAGLMRSLGIMVIDRIADNYPEMPPYHPAQDADYLSWEGRSFGIGACEIAGMVLTAWGFPDEIVQAIRSQYQHHPSDREHRLGIVLNLASGLVATLGAPLIGEASHWGDAAAKAQRLGMTEARLQQIGRRGREALERFQKRFLQPEDAGLPGGKPLPAPDSCNFPIHVRVLSTKPDDIPVPTEPPAGPVTAVDFTTFMRNYQDMVYTTAVRLLGNEAQAEDISQEVFLKAYERFDDLSTSPTAGGWLKTVTTNMSINHLQRYRKRWRFFSELVRQDDDGGEDDSPVEFASPDSDFVSGLNQSDRRAWVEQALEKLPTHQRVPLVLYHFEDMPYEEIARQLSVSLAKVKTDILRGRTALAQILARSGTVHETLQPQS